VVGSGPASITVAADVRREGHEVTCSKPFTSPSAYCCTVIPEFRLPKAIVQKEIESLSAMAWTLKPISLSDVPAKLLDTNGKRRLLDAIFVGTRRRTSQIHEHRRRKIWSA
jgi:glutamate synthase (NADPH/NADH) small chain